jgi:CheY-like chemotaxis protein
MHSPRILIVEDEVITAQSLKITLEGMGFEVCGVANTGEEAIDGVNRTEPDLILMDINLKGEMDGTEAAAMILSKHDIPVIYMTAYSSDEVLNKAMVTAPFAYLVKPARDSELRSNIRMALYKHESERDRKRMMEQIKLLSGLLPICYHCKSIRDDKGYWEKLEKFLAEYADVQFSHGICPDCARKHHPEVDWDEVDGK